MGETGRVRRVQNYPLNFKLELVTEAMAPGASVSAISRQRNVNANLIFTWRKLYRQGMLGSPGALDGHPSFIPVGIVDGTGQAVPMTIPAAADAARATPRSVSRPVPVSRAIELELRNGIKLRFDAGIASDTLRRVVGAIKNCP